MIRLLLQEVFTNYATESALDLRCLAVATLAVAAAAALAVLAVGLARPMLSWRLTGLFIKVLSIFESEAIIKTSAKFKRAPFKDVAHTHCSVFPYLTRKMRQINLRPFIMSLPIEKPVK